MPRRPFNWHGDSIAMKSKLNTATIRHAGNSGHTITRSNLTDYEVRLLRRIHGQDAVVNVVETGEDERDERAEYLRLARFYGVGIVEKTFSIVLDEFAEWIDAEMSAERDARDVAAVAVQAKPEAKPAKGVQTAAATGLD